MRALVVTVSDGVSSGHRRDLSGVRAGELLLAHRFDTEVRVVPDGVESVAEALRRGVDEGFDLIVTTGGTGMGPRDLTPEGTRRVIDREAPGLAEAMRAVTFGSNPHGMLSRGVCGIAESTLILNLPGSPKGVEESLAVVGPALGHAVALLRGDPTNH
jgi:molybdopterin adenylyltransferase